MLLVEDGNRKAENTVHAEIRRPVDSPGLLFPASAKAAPPLFRATSAPILRTSPAFDDGAAIPVRHAGVGLGENLSPPELVLVMQDSDALLPRPPVHLIATGIPGDCRAVGEGHLAPSAPHKIAFRRDSFGRFVPGHRFCKSSSTPCGNSAANFRRSRFEVANGV